MVGFSSSVISNSSQRNGKEVSKEISPHSSHGHHFLHLNSPSCEENRHYSGNVYREKCGVFTIPGIFKLDLASCVFGLFIFYIYSLINTSQAGEVEKSNNKNNYENGSKNMRLSPRPRRFNTRVHRSCSFLHVQRSKIRLNVVIAN